METTYRLSADQMAALIAEHGLARMVEVVEDAAKAVVGAFGPDGIPAPLNWHARQASGAVLFYQIGRDAAGHEVITGDERLLCVNAPEADRARWESIATESDAPVRVLLLPAAEAAARADH
jgi:hypothetical protein